MDILLDFSFLILLFISSVSDILYRRIPNQIIITGIALWLFASLAGLLLHESPMKSLENLACACMVSAPVFLVSFLYKKFSGKKAFGGGDIKLLFMTGLIFLPAQAPALLAASLFCSALYAAAVNIRLFFHNTKSESESVPFAIQRKCLIKARCRAVPFAPSVFAAAVFVKCCGIV